MKTETTDKEFSVLLDDHLSHLGELFHKAHTEGLDKMFDEPERLSDEFIATVVRGIPRLRSWVIDKNKSH